MNKSKFPQTNSKNKHENSIAFNSFFVEYYNEVEIDYDHLITDFYTFKKYPNSLKRMRNILIKLTFLQIISSILSMLFIIFRRSFLYLFVSLLTLILAVCGVTGSMKMHQIYLLIHCVFTISITAGFMIYQLVDFFLAPDTSYGNQERINDNFIMFIFTLPFTFDFAVGVYNYYFLKNIAVINERNKEINHRDEEQSIDLEFNRKKISEEQVDQFIAGVDSRICIICMDKNRDVVLNPCGHVLCCDECAKNIFSKSIMYEVKCPLCRRKCTSYVKMLVC